MTYDVKMVSEEIVAEAWRDVATFGPADALREMKRISRRQHDLLVFVTTMCEQLSENAQEVAIYTFVVLYRMFERSHGKPLPKAKPRQVTAAFEALDRDLGRLIGADDRFVERHARLTTEAEPFVMQYVSEVLMEPDDPDAKLSDEEVGEVFMYLKTVVDVLHQVSASA